MKRLALLLISLISFLFGCSDKKTPAPKPAAWPRFPESDNPSVKIEAILPDSLSVLKAFYIPADKKQVFVLTCKSPKPKDPDQNFNVPEMVDFKVLCLDEKGKIVHQVNLPQSDVRYGADFGMLEDQFLVRLSDVFLVFDTEQWVNTEKIPIYFDQRFPSKQKVALMMPDEQRSAYAAAFDDVTKTAQTCHFLEWSPSGEGYVLTLDAKGNRAAWSPQPFVDNHREALKKMYPNSLVLINPGYQYDATTNLSQIADDHALIQEVEILPDGTQQYWHTDRVRQIIQYAMTVGGKQMHFSTGNRDGHSLRLIFSDNKMLSTRDGAVWVQYEGVLYRIE